MVFNDASKERGVRSGQRKKTQKVCNNKRSYRVKRHIAVVSLSISRNLECD